MVFMASVILCCCISSTFRPQSIFRLRYELNKRATYNLLNICNSGKNMSIDNFNYKTGASSVVYVTTPDEKTAKKLAEHLIEQKLAACVNIISNIISVYKWDGKLNEDNEHLMIIKTRTSRLEELTKWIQDNHPYSVAEVISVPITQGSIPYLKWLNDSVPEKS